MQRLVTILKCHVNHVARVVTDINGTYHYIYKSSFIASTGQSFEQWLRRQKIVTPDIRLGTETCDAHRDILLIRTLFLKLVSMNHRHWVTRLRHLFTLSSSTVYFILAPPTIGHRYHGYRPETESLSLCKENLVLSDWPLLKYTKSIKCFIYRNSPG